MIFTFPALTEPTRKFTCLLSSAIAVRVSVDTWREQYCTKRLMWHMPFPNTQLLLTNRTCGTEQKEIIRRTTSCSFLEILLNCCCV